MNVRNWSEEKLNENGLFPVVIDNSYDSRIHDLGEIYWDSAANVFKKDISDKTFSQSLSELKENRINHFKSIINSELSKTDWYIIRSIDFIGINNFF